MGLGKINTINISAWLVRIAGVVALISVPLSIVPTRIEQYLPYDPDSISRILGIFIGIILLYISAQLFNRKRTAFILAVIGLSLLIVFDFLHQSYHLPLILYSGILILLIQSRKQYIVRSDFRSASKIVSTSVAVVFVLLVVVAASFLIIDNREFGVHLTATQDIRITWDAILGKPIPKYLFESPQAHFLINLMRFSILFAIATMLFAIFRPRKLGANSSSFQFSQAQRILERYSSSSEDYFKIWPTRNKHFFFYDDSFICYGLKNGIAFILDGCTGNRAHFSTLRRAFSDECFYNGWEITVIHADEEEAKGWAELTFQKQYIGSEARVDISHFESIENNKHFRYVKNKANTENLHVEFWQAPHTIDRIAKLKSISNDWLNNDRREYEFVMGYFNGSYLSDCNVSVLYKDDEPIAFINLIPTFDNLNSSVDLMRFRKNIPSISMHFLFLKTIEELRNHNIATLNLGLAPLSKLDDNISSISDKFLIVIKKIGRRYYSFEGLEQFKNKFEPSWEPRYILYKGSAANLPQIILGLNTLLSYKDKK